MNFFGVLLTTLISSAAFATALIQRSGNQYSDPSLLYFGWVYESTDVAEKTQLKVLETQLTEAKQISSTIRFFSVPSPSEVYQNVTELKQKAANAFRASTERTLGGAPRQVFVTVGLYGYACVAKVRFHNAIEIENVRYVSLGACRGPFNSDVRTELEGQCAVAKTQEEMRKSCRKLGALIDPKDLSFERTF